MHIKKKALIIAAHPDDDILGCGGLMSLYQSKIEFKVLFIAEGSSCRFTDLECIECQKEISRRNQMAVSALNKLSINQYHFCNFPCGRLDQVPLIEINKAIEKQISDFKPDTIFTHSDIDSNQDHVKVNKATIIATRPFNTCVENVLEYEVLSSTEWGFRDSFVPNVFLELSEVNILDKVKSLSVYETEMREFPFPRSKDGIINNARYRGMQSGFNYAECFRLVRSCTRI